MTMKPCQPFFLAHLLVFLLFYSSEAFLPRSNRQLHTASVVPIKGSQNLVPKPIATPANIAATATTRSRTTALHAGVPSFISSPLGSLAILAAIVLVHESGHYLAARAYGIAVEEFSVGVGPKLFGFRAFGNDFCLRALPLGGYVRFPENYNATAVREQELAVEAQLQTLDETREKTVGTEIINALTFGSLQEQHAKKEKLRMEQELSEYEKLPWWRRVGKKKPVVVNDMDDVDIDYYSDPDLLQNRPWYQRAVVLSAGVIFNLLLAFCIYFGEISYGTGLPSPVFDTGVLVSSIPRADAAANGILKKGDVIIGVNGVPLMESQQQQQQQRPTMLQAQRAINSVISQIRETPEGESIQFTVLHPNEKTPEQIRIQPKRFDEQQTIGVLLSPNYVSTTFVKSSNWGESAALAANYVSRLTVETASGLASFLGETVTGRASSNQVSGPIGLIRTGSEVVATQDWTTVLIFAAAISINLGVVNAFPLPALDGGQLVFILVEAVSGRKVDQRLQEGITGAALLFLLFVSVGAAFGDLESIFSSR